MNISNKPLNFRGGAHDRGGDSERLSDAIFEATGAQVRIRLHHGTVWLSADDLADYYLARSWLVRDRGFPRENVIKQL